MNDSVNKNRNSSLELLRIISMMMIIAHHYSVHGDFPEVCVNTISFSTVYNSILSIFGKSACGIYALITGFFMIDSNNGLKEQLKKSILLAAEMLFYSLLAVVLVYSTKIVSLSLKDLLNAFIPYFKDCWYVRSYIFFSLGIPYINVFLKSINKKLFEEMLFVVFVVWVVLSTLFGNIIDIGYLGFMLFMYFFGAYTKMYKSNNKYNNKINLYIALICAVLLVTSVVCFNIIAILSESSFILSHDRWFMPWNSLLSFGMSFFLFVYACRKNYYNSVINKVSSTMLGVYLFHDNDLMRNVIWRIWFPNSSYINNIVLHSFLKIIAVLIVGIIIDLIRQNFIEKIFKKWLNKNYNAIYENIEKNSKKINELLKKYIFKI